MRGSILLFERLMFAINNVPNVCLEGKTTLLWVGGRYLCYT